MHRSLAEPGLLLAGDFTRAEDFSKWVSAFRYPLWDEHGQSSNLVTLTQLGIYAPAIIISSVIEVPTTVVYLAYFVVFGSISGVFSFKLAEYVMVRQKLKPHFAFPLASSLFFMFATFVVETTTHPVIAISFYLSPLLLYALIRGVEQNSNRYLLLSSFIYSLMAAAPHFLIFGLILILSYIVYDLLYKIGVQRFRSISALKQAAWYTLIAVGPFIALSSYWILPNLAFGGLEFYSNLLTTRDPVILYRYADIINIFSIKGAFNSGDVYPFTDSERAYINILSITLTVIAVSSLVLYKPNKLLLYLGVLLIVSVSISIIPYYLPDLYNWLIFHIPGSFLYSWVFRSPKFFHFMSIPIAVMLALSGLRIYQILYKQKKRFSKAVPSIFISIILVLSLVPNYILLTGDFNGFHRSYNLPGYYTDALAFLEKQDGNYKSIWGPPYGGSNSTWHGNRIGPLEEQISPTNTFSGLETLHNYIYPIIFGIRVPYGSMVHQEQTNILNEFMGPLGVKYIVLHNDLPVLTKYIDSLSTAISNQKGLLESNEFDPITVYTIDDAAEHFSIKQNVILIQGGGFLKFDSAFRTESINSNSTGVLFSDISLDQNPKMWNISDTLIPDNELPYAEYMLQKSDVIVIPPSAYTNDYQPRELWSKGSATMPAFLNTVFRAGIELPHQFDYGRNIVFTSANNSQLAIPLSISQPGEYKVLLRYFANEKGGSLDLNLGEKSETVETMSNINRFIWTDLGTFGLSKGTQTLSIENGDGFNAINLIALIPAEKYEHYKAEFINSLRDKDIIHIFEAESDFNFIDRTGLSRDSTNPLRVVSDLDYSNGKALELRSRAIASTEFEILSDGLYNLAVYGNGTITAYIDGVTSRTISLEKGVPHIESVQLKPGNHLIEITQGANSTNFAYLDSIFIELVKNDENEGNNQSSSLLEHQQPREESIVTYQKIDPTNYEVTVKAESFSSSSSFMLAFAEAYDARWIAEVEETSSADTKKKIYRPLPLYGAINGFNIDTEGLEGGEYVIHIKYAPQEIFYVGAWISGFSYAAVIVYLIRARLTKFLLNRNNSR